MRGAADGIVSIRYASVSTCAEDMRSFAQSASPCYKNGGDMPNRQVFNAEHMQIIDRQLEEHFIDVNIRTSDVLVLCLHLTQVSRS